MRPIATLGWIAVMTAALAAQGALGFDAPKEWTAQPSTSSMRVAQYSLARAAGDSEDAELIVYYFGGSGGSVDANLDRWLGQMEQPDGKPSKAVAKTSTMTTNGLKVTVLDVSGSLCGGDDARLADAAQQAELPDEGRGDRNAEGPLLRQADRPCEDGRALGHGVRGVPEERAV